MAILIATLLVYKLAKGLFGLELRLKSLLLCAVCAMFISLVLPKFVVGFAGLPGTLAFLAVFAAAFAYFVAHCEEAPAADKRDESACCLTDSQAQPAAIEQNETVNQNKQQEKNCRTFDISEPVAAEAPAVADPAVAEPVIIEDEDEDIEDIEDIEETMTDSLSEVIEVISESQRQEEYIQIVPLVPQLFMEQAGGTVHEDGNSVRFYNNKEEVEVDEPAAVQLDDLLDYAFLNKEQHNYEAALTAFKQALSLQPASEAAPFLVVEVGNLLKNKGHYDEAIKVFSEGRQLCQTRGDKMLEQEFISTIAYLRIVKNILVQHRLGAIKFLEIPQHIVKEIDEEFREWRNVANI
ncbi:hypothetical protein [Sporomusa termitida]|uniref:hypothetical protein n=1 Tax=Sporomusa termitida TaxID=2377 RepID=UPI0014782568|nr:hypothetical protein [Sporomusa termitida]